jgi:hypothetical protein
MRPFVRDVDTIGAKNGAKIGATRIGPRAGLVGLSRGKKD